MVRYREESDWKHVELVGRFTAVGIKRDGSMWTWDLEGLHWRPHNWQSPPVPLSGYTIWISACGYERASLSLGSDNTLCLWGDPEDDLSLDRTGRYSQRLLLPSRIHASEIARLSP